MTALNMSRRGWRLAAIIAAAGAAMVWTAAALGETLIGGVTALSDTFFAAGGGVTLTGGTIIATDVIGSGAATPMGGGRFRLMPGGPGIPPLATADFSFVHAFPTPFQPSLGHDRITFRGLPPRVTIRIYTITGQLVQTLNKNDAFTADLVWKPVTNASGRDLASGVYFYLVTGENGRASGKLMVIR